MSGDTFVLVLPLAKVNLNLIDLNSNPAGAVEFGKEYSVIPFYVIDPKDVYEVPPSKA